ncbi:MAG: hypothetical protein F4Z54_03020 [Acidimicrobiaceae bacterium]|nr:hypothetical protein [Acidimicrobiaceae bacterium]
MTRKIWNLLFRRVRWSDGSVASFWFDRLALALLALSVVLEIVGMAIAWGLYDSPGLGLVTILPGGLAVLVGAKIRLRLAIDRAERDGISDRDVAVPAIFERFVNISRWHNRFNEWGALRCETAEEKFLARADAAAAEGDDRSAVRYRARARRERRYADFIRRQTDR